jgi:hypothetical protein
MFNQFLTALCLCALALPASAQTAPPAPSDAQRAPEHTLASEEALDAVPTEAILVPGQRPGPGLWKVSKGEHVLWLFGSYTPLPKNMEWRSQQVETILAQSQEFLRPPGASAGVGIFKGLMLLPFAIGFKNNPDGALLRDLMPAEVHARWLVLKKKYIGTDEGMERERPMFAAETLFRRGLQQNGLSGGDQARQAIERMVVKNKMKTTSPNVEVTFDDPLASLKRFKKTALADIPCFSATLERFETGVEALQRRAAAWAKGDVQAMMALNYRDRDEACQNVITNSEFVKGQTALQSMHARMQVAWLGAAETALAANASTFGLLPLHEILDPNGYVAALRAKGYQVEAPD